MLNVFFGNKIARFSASLLLVATALLAGCGGGGLSAGTTGTTGTTGTAGAAAVVSTITGTVATGAPLVGATVKIRESAAPFKEAIGTTVAGGVFSIDVTGMTPPFMLVAIPAVAGQSNMYSILPAMDMAATNTQNVNITPVTTLVMYELSGGTDPATMYTGRTFNTVTAANVSAKETIVRSKLPANTVNPVFDMMYSRFVASVAAAGTNPDPYDAALDAIGRITAITATNVTFAVAPAYTPAAAGAGAVATVAAPSIALTLTDPVTLAATTSIASTSPARVTATVKNANGAAVANAIVTFTTSDPRDTFSGGANTALTDALGVATVTLTTSNTSGGASTVTASSTVAGAAVTNSLNYAIGTSTITLSALTLPALPLSAYGTASVSVNVLNNGLPYTTPMTVSFTSGCASKGKATLTSSVTTVNGTATASYLDNGCNNAAPGDNITATLMNGVTATGNLPVNPPSIGSIQFVSVVTNPVTTPTMITIKGTGGVNRSETARMVFKVVDSAGNPIGNAPVVFSLNTSLGGLTLSSYSANSDPVTGQVVTNVIAGKMSTAVRVTATTGNLSTQSDQLLVSTGVPAQDSFSLSASSHNIEGWNWDGTATTLTARLADHFHNPVPDGTAVYFTSEGGSIVPSCTTVGGVCSAALTSQALRPTSGRVTVLARAIGEEAFTDLDSNGVVSTGEMIDANGVATDMGEAYVDYNENGLRDSLSEPYFDFGGDGLYTGTTLAGTTPAEIVGGYHAPVGATTSGDGLYNGVLCNAVATPALCSTQKSIDVRGSQVIVFSGSNAVITINGGLPINLPTCTIGVAEVTASAGPPQVAAAAATGGPGGPSTFTVTVVDVNGNAMPVGTTVAFTTNNGTITSSTGYTVPDTTGCRTGYPGCPASHASAIFGDASVSMRSDATWTAGVQPALNTCTNTVPSGTFTVTVTTPKGNITTGSVTVND